jgi:SAM-dependent methyltransferase
MDQSNIIASRQIDIYNEVADKYGASSKAVLLDDPQTQYFRFSELVKSLDLDDRRKTLLDVGCGNGELYKFLNFLGFRGQYVGYDINEKLLTQARSRFANIEVHNENIMSDEMKQRFDYVVLSGLFNVDVGQSTAWVHDFLKKMFELCDCVMVFNMISTRVTFRDEGTYYMDPAEVLTFCIENLSKRTTLSHHNLPYNFTVSVFRSESWESAKEQIS